MLLFFYSRSIMISKPLELSSACNARFHPNPLIDRLNLLNLAFKNFQWNLPWTGVLLIWSVTEGRDILFRELADRNFISVEFSHMRKSKHSTKIFIFHFEVFPKFIKGLLGAVSQKKRELPGDYPKIFLMFTENIPRNIKFVWDKYSKTLL